MTAEELFSKHFNGLHYDDITQERIQKYAIEFAKMHVAEALKQVEESIYINAICNICCSGSEIAFKENPILNCYSLDNVE